MYLTFDVTYQHELDHIKHQIQLWADQYSVSYTQKTIKNTHRLSFNREKDFTLFYMTWQGEPYKIVDLGNERY
jgi:hypothetical protein